MRHIGVLMAFTENDPEAQSWTAGFREELGKLGWTEGHNIRIDTRWATADVESLQRFAKQLVALSKARSVPACQLPKMGPDGSVRAVFNAAFAYVVALPDRSQGRTKGTR